MFTRSAVCAALLTLGAGPLALAQEPIPLPACELSLQDLRDMLARGHDALLEDDLDAVTSLQDDLRRQVPCLDQVVPADDWATHLVTLSIAAYYAGDDWQTPLASALAASPTVDRRVPPTHVVSRWSPPAIAVGGDARPVPTGVSAWLDGRRVNYAAPLRGPHLVQAQVDGQLRSLLVDGDGSASAWDALLPDAFAPPPVEAPQEIPALPVVVEDDRRSGTGWMVAGGGIALVGAGVGVGTWSAREQGHDDQGTRTGLVVGNTVGWSLAAVGGGLLTVGVVRSLDSDLRLGLGPRSIHFGGSFR